MITWQVAGLFPVFLIAFMALVEGLSAVLAYPTRRTREHQRNTALPSGLTATAIYVIVAMDGLVAVYIAVILVALLMVIAGIMSWTGKLRHGDVK